MEKFEIEQRIEMNKDLNKNSKKEGMSRTMIGSIFMIIGVIVLMIGIFFLIAHLNFVNKGTVVKGTISEGYVNFETESGKNTGVTSKYIELLEKYTNNKEVDIVYNPENPENAKVNSFGSLWFTPSLMIIVGLAFIAIGFWNVFKEDEKTF